MKDTMLKVGLGMASGMAITAYMMSNPSTKRKAKNMVDDAICGAKDAIDNMKKMNKQN